MKKIIIICSLAFGYSFAQNGTYYKSETVYEGKMMGSMPTTSIEMFSRGGEYKIIMNLGDKQNIRSCTNSKVSIYNKEGNGNPDCAEGTPEEYEASTKKHAEKSPEFKNIQVKKTGKTETILGYECQIATISYEIKMGMGLTSKSEETVWYTEDIKTNSSKTSTLASESYVNTNALTDAYTNLGGFVLKKESKSKMGGTTTTKVLEFEKRDISDEELNIGMACKKTLTLEQYFKLMEDRAEAQRRAEMQRNQMMRGY